MNKMRSSLSRECPKGRDQPKKPFITEQIWQIREAKLVAKKKLQDLARRRRDERLIVVFQAWKSGKQPEVERLGEAAWHYETFPHALQFEACGEPSTTGHDLEKGS